MRTAKWLISFLTPGITYLSYSVNETLPGDRDWPKLLIGALCASFGGPVAMGFNKLVMDRKVKK